MTEQERLEKFRMEVAALCTKYGIGIQAQLSTDTSTSEVKGTDNPEQLIVSHAKALLVFVIDSNWESPLN